MTDHLTYLLMKIIPFEILSRLKNATQFSSPSTNKHTNESRMMSHGHTSRKRLLIVYAEEAVKCISLLFPLVAKKGKKLKLIPQKRCIIATLEINFAICMIDAISKISLKPRMISIVNHTYRWIKS